MPNDPDRALQSRNRVALAAHRRACDNSFQLGAAWTLGEIAHLVAEARATLDARGALGDAYFRGVSDALDGIGARLEHMVAALPTQAALAAAARRTARGDD